MTDETKLLPCPFCGGEAKLNHHSVSDQYWVTCVECDFDGHMPIQHDFGAISQWNTRPAIPDEAALVEIVERVQGDELDNIWIGFSEAVVKALRPHLSNGEDKARIAELEKLLGNKKYIALKAKYNLGQLSFYGQIQEYEKSLKSEATPNA
ncbi:MAG: hypothetical protein COA96_10215 [SAR86 cluster bacterium]|uniref:Restriction alleviation protein, Lar family n=1 Tax=SAR86 cluster bacterium TaxID=2030880 RepID=A0A2A5AYA2_9GAMM|nr:MAG: hypothetical protein COA96_10215 [SAR86 cluster bacterium]